MGSSAAFHLLHVVDKRAFELLSRADYVGIALLIAGSVFPPYTYSFWCEPFFRCLYLSLICALCLCCCVMGMLERFSTKKYLWPRTLAFMGAGLANLVPMLHLALAGRSMQHEEVRYVLRALGIMAVFYVGGAFIYGLRIPERWARGRFDYFGSHAIWHVLVLAACLTHYDAVLVHWRWRSRFMDCSSKLALL
jgi:adiponectin receptor